MAANDARLELLPAALLRKFQKMSSQQAELCDGICTMLAELHCSEDYANSVMQADDIMLNVKSAVQAHAAGISSLSFHFSSVVLELEKTSRSRKRTALSSVIDGYISLRAAADAEKYRSMEEVIYRLCHCRAMHLSTDVSVRAHNAIRQVLIMCLSCAM